MHRSRQESVVSETKFHFNFTKLQAVACMAVSAAISISLIAWGIKAFG